MRAKRIYSLHSHEFLEKISFRGICGGLIALMCVLILSSFDTTKMYHHHLSCHLITMTLATRETIMNKALLREYEREFVSVAPSPPTQNTQHFIPRLFILVVVFLLLPLVSSSSKLLRRIRRIFCRETRQVRKFFREYFIAFRFAPGNLIFSCKHSFVGLLDVLVRCEERIERNSQTKKNAQAGFSS